MKLIGRFSWVAGFVDTFAIAIVVVVYAVNYKAGKQYKFIKYLHTHKQN